MTLRLVGVDVGGTFTDAVSYDESTGRLVWSKASSTPGTPETGVLDAIGRLDTPMREVDRFVHGVTIGTNAILERRGAEVWVVTTRGFRDTLEITRTNRTVLYNIKTLKPPSLVPRQRVLEVRERLAADGTILEPLDESDLAAVIDTLSRANARAVAVCFLHSYANPGHEQSVAAALRDALPNAFVCASSEILPEFREYERFVTTVLNCYIGPLTARYLDSLRASLKDTGFTRPVFIMSSNGGVATAERAAQRPVQTVLSGPAAGVAAAVDLGRRLGITDLITYDMGGTSTDVCLIRDLTVPVTNEQFIAGYPNRTPQIEINTVGAGGGSIAWLDAGRILKVGPRSAGAEPGPACYGRGGTEATVTDANVVLDRLSPGTRLGDSTLDIDAPSARDALERLATQVGGIATRTLAEGVLRIAVARMVSAIKEISISNGHDPRDFTLVAYGGAGPMHAVAVAAEMEITRVLVPVAPGNFSAYGSLISDLRLDFVRTHLLDTADTSMEDLESTFGDMEAHCRDAFAREGFDATGVVMHRALAMRFAGQAWELPVALPPGAASLAEVESLFRDAYQQRYDSTSQAAIEIVNFRLAGVLPVPKPAPQAMAAVGVDPPVNMRDVCFDDALQASAVYWREDLPAGWHTAGPAIVEEMGAVTVIPPGWTARCVDTGELLLDRELRDA